MSVKHLKTFADLAVADAAICCNEQEIVEIDAALKHLSERKAKLKGANNRLKHDCGEWALALMVSLSHRRFCRLMGFAL